MPMTIQTVLIPTDGSDRSTAAARRGFDLAAALDCTVHALSVVDSSIATGAGYGGDSPSIRKRLREKATERATSLRDEATQRGIEATAVTREGIPAKEIVTYAADAGIDAIILGTSGRGGIARTVMGSVADKVVRTASIPVITITPAAARAETTDAVDTILLPTDGSEPATAAAEFGVELASQLTASVHLLSVIDHSRSSIRSRILGAESAGDEAALRERATAQLNALASGAREAGVEAHVTVTDGDPAEEIVQYAESKAIDLIALGTVGRGGFDRLLVGSVADHVIRTAPIPVLTTRSTDTKELQTDL